MIARRFATGSAMGLILLCGACGQKAQHERRNVTAAAAEAPDPAAVAGDDDAEFGSDAPTPLKGSLYVTVDGLEVADSHGVTTRVPFGTSEAAVVAAVKPAVGVAEKVFSVPCGDRKVVEHDYQSVTLSFEGGALVSWRAFGAIRMPSGIGEGTPRYALAAAYPDLHKTERPPLDTAQSFAAGPIRGYIRENMVTSIDGGKPLCIG